MACQGVLVEMGDLKRIAWGSLKVFHFLAPREHWHLPVLGTGVGSPSHCWPSFWLSSVLVTHRGNIVSNFLCSTFFEKANFLLQILQHCCHSSHAVWLLPCMPLFWHDFLFHQGHLTPLSGSYFIFSHRLRGRRWHISTFVVLLSWRHALRRDCFFPLLYPVPSEVAKMWECLFLWHAGPRILGQMIVVWWTGLGSP